MFLITKQTLDDIAKKLLSGDLNDATKVFIGKHSQILTAKGDIVVSLKDLENLLSIIALFSRNEGVIEYYKKLNKLL